MKKRTNRSDFLKEAYSESKTYFNSDGHIDEYGAWMSSEERTSYYEDCCTQFYKDVTRIASSMRI